MADNSAKQATNGADLLDTAAGGSARRTALDQIRTYLVELTAVLDQQEPSLHLPEAQWRLAELNEELAHEHPSAPRAQSRWMRLAPVLGEVLPDLPTDWLTRLLKQALNAR